MEEELDDQESLEPEDDQESNLEDGSEELTKAQELAKNQKIRAEKAEAELKKLKQQAENKTPENKEEKQSNEPDYAKLAFLEGKGIQHPDDQKIVQDEAARLKLPLTDVLGMEHIKSKLKDSKDQRDAEDGMPDGSGTPSGKTRSTVDYWVDKTDKDGNYLSPTSDPELHAKVIEARMKKQDGSKMFDDPR